MKYCRHWRYPGVRLREEDRSPGIRGWLPSAIVLEYWDAARRGLERSRKVKRATIPGVGQLPTQTSENHCRPIGTFIPRLPLPLDHHVFPRPTLPFRQLVNTNFTTHLPQTAPNNSLHVAAFGDPTLKGCRLAVVGGARATPPGGVRPQLPRPRALPRFVGIWGRPAPQNSSIVFTA